MPELYETLQMAGLVDDQTLGEDESSPTQYSQPTTNVTETEDPEEKSSMDLGSILSDAGLMSDANIEKDKSEPKSHYAGALKATTLDALQGLSGVLKTVGLSGMAENVDWYYGGIKSKDKDVQDFYNSVAEGTESIWPETLGSAGPTGMAAAMSLIPYAGIPLATAYFWHLNTDEIKDLAIEKGADEDTAENIAWVGGTVNSALDMFGIGVITKRVPGLKKLADGFRNRLVGASVHLLSSGVSEGVTEPTQGLIAELSSEYAASKDVKDFLEKVNEKEWWDSAFERMKKEAFIGAALGVVGGGVVEGTMQAVKSLEKSGGKLDVPRTDNLENVEVEEIVGAEDKDEINPPTTDELNQMVGDAIEDEAAQKTEIKEPVESEEGVSPEKGTVTPITEEKIDQEANKAATSTENEIPEPSKEQIEAGNYKKGHINIQGLDISIENPKGSTRKGVSPDGKEWKTRLATHYGYIKKTEGADGDQVDVFIGPKTVSEKVYVVDQVDPKTGKFDEHKVMVGFLSSGSAKTGYLRNYDRNWKGLGDITEASMGEFKLWLKQGKTSQPFSKWMAKKEEWTPRSGAAVPETTTGIKPTFKPKPSIEIKNQKPFKREIDKTKLPEFKKLPDKPKIIEVEKEKQPNLILQPGRGKEPQNFLRKATERIGGTVGRTGLVPEKERVLMGKRKAIDRLALELKGKKIRVKSPERSKKKPSEFKTDEAIKPGTSGEQRDLFTGKTGPEKGQQNIFDAIEETKKPEGPSKPKGKYTTEDESKLAVAYHGGPSIWEKEKRFPNGRPRLDKIGTGEGGQAFGWGIYFAEKKETGESYIQVNPPEMFRGKNIADELDSINRQMDMAKIGSRKFIQLQEKYSVLEDIALGKSKEDIQEKYDDKEYLNVTRELARSIKTDEVSSHSIYKLDIPDEIIPKLFDWDKIASDELIDDLIDVVDNKKVVEILKETKNSNDFKLKINRRSKYAVPELLKIPQSTYGHTINGIPLVIENEGDVYRALTKKYPELVEDESWAEKVSDDVFNTRSIPPKITSGELYRKIVRALGGNDKKTSKIFKKAGFLGTKYFDSLSRERGDGSYNYVIWDQPSLNIIAIFERNYKNVENIVEEESRLNASPEATPKQINQSRIAVNQFRKWMKTAGLPKEVLDDLDIEAKKVVKALGDIKKSKAEHKIPSKSAMKIMGSTTLFEDGRTLVQYASDESLILMEDTAYHEAFHVMMARLISPESKTALLDHFNGNEEDAAKAFSKFVVNKETTGIPKGIRKIFYQLRRALRRVANGFKASKYETVDDWFDALYFGGVKETNRGMPIKGQKLSTPAPPFFSQLIKTVETGIKDMPAKAQALTNWLQKKQVKPAEMKWMGVDQWIKENQKDGKIDKEEFLDFLKSNEIQVQEVEKKPEVYDSEQPGIADTEEPEDATKFGQYTLPGGQNYRELLFTLPTVSGKVSDETAKSLGMQKGYETDYVYRSGHWDEPNVLGHVRFNERTDSEGNRVLFLEEIQSDWHQEGKKKGYANKNELSKQEKEDLEFYNKRKVEYELKIAKEVENRPRHDSISKELYGVEYGDLGAEKSIEYVKEIFGERKKEYNRSLYDARANLANINRKINEIKGNGVLDGVPPAPFADNWHEVLFKRALRYAAENGFDKLAWTTGEQQADRYDLSKHVERIIARKSKDGRYSLRIYLHTGQVEFMDSLSENKIEENVGKELAEKIVSQEMGRNVEYEGLDLKVGGEGMKSFYDNLLPGFAKKYVKQWGAKVGTSEIGVSEDLDMGGFSKFLSDKGLDRNELSKAKEAALVKEYATTLQNSVPVHSIPITDSMRQSVIMQGQSWFNAEEKPRVDYIGFMEDVDGNEIPLYNVFGHEAIQDGSTVTGNTLKKHGIEIPETKLNVSHETIEDMKKSSNPKDGQSLRGLAGINDVYDSKEDKWFSEKDYELLKNNVEVANLQNEIKKVLGLKRYNKKARDIDAAIHIYLDTKRNPEHFDEYYNDIDDEDKIIADLSRTIEDNPKLLAIANKMAKSYEELGERAKDEDVINDTIKNYAGRVWEVKGRSGTDVFNKFITKSRHSKQRVFETILEGMATKGMKLKVKGATNNLKVVKDEIAKVIEDKKLLKTLQKTEHLDTGEMIFTDKPGLEGYEKLEGYHFYTWKPYGSVKGGKTKGTYVNDAGREVQVGKNARITKKYAIENQKTGRSWKNFDMKEEAISWMEENHPEGRLAERVTLWEKRQLFAPEAIADRLNKITGRSILSGKLKVKGVSAVDVITKYNAVLKSTLLMTGLFHHQAFMRSYLFGTRHKTAHEWRPIKAYKEGIEAINNLDKEIELGVRNGLTLGVMQDWEEQLLQSETVFGRIMDKHKISKDIKDKLNNLRERQARFLFGELGSGLKAKAFMIEYRNAIKEHPEMEENERARMVASLINADFGGLHLGRIGRDPTAQHIFRLFALAPDWTESNVLTMVRAIKGGSKSETRLYRKFWASILTKVTVATLVSNIALSLAAGDDDDEFFNKFKRAWKEGNLKWMDVNITPIYRAMGGKEESEKYFSLIGHFRDPMKFIIHPIRSAHHKGSVIYRFFHEIMKGEDWKGAKFTTFPELIGVDDKGVYVTTRKGKYRAGEKKGGKLAGQTASYRSGAKGGPIGITQIPSYLISQGKGFLPIQAQSAIAWASGESNWFDAITKGAGLYTSTTYPNKKKTENMFVERYADAIRSKKGVKAINKINKEVVEYNRRRKVAKDPESIISTLKIRKKAFKIVKNERLES